PLQWPTANQLRVFNEFEGNIRTRTYTWEGDRNIRTMSFIGPPQVLYAADSSDQGEVNVIGTKEGFPLLNYTSAANGRPLTLVDPTPHTKDWKFPTIEPVTWKAPDGASVGGPLELPYGWKKGDKPLPLVVAIHGGPTTASYSDQRFDPHNRRPHFPAPGYALLFPDQRR